MMSEEWIKIDDDSVKIPFSKLCVSDGVNIFFARLINIVNDSSGRHVNFEVFNLPKNYGKFRASHWRNLKLPF